MKIDFALIRAAFLLTVMVLLSGCGNHPPLATVPAVELDRYLGRWYEISSIPQRFSRGCHCTSAEYKLHPEGYIEVYNSCRKDSPTGEKDDATGKAFPVEGSNNSKLKVQFQWPFKGDYWILELAEDYSHAVVGSPDRESLWVLSRTPSLNEATYAQLVQRARDKGFPVEELQLMDQSCY